MKMNMTHISALTINDFTQYKETQTQRRNRHKEKYPRQSWAAYAKRDAKKRAEKKGVPFNLTREYIESILPTHCPVFNTPFQYGGNGKIKPESPALDRIIPSLGYIEGNVHIISVKANNIKSAYSAQEVMIVAKWLESMEKPE